MGIINLINEKLVLPANDLLFGRTINRHFAFLQKSQWWSIDEIEHYQNEQLQKLIKHAFINVPYYNELFKENKLTPEDIKTQEDLYKIPILTKEIIRNNFPNKIVAQNIPRRKMFLAGSSGSTGQPLQYYLTKDALSFARACNIRGWYWMGFRLGDPYMKISTMPRSSFYKKAQDFVTSSYHIYSKSLTYDSILRIIDTIRRSKVRVIRGYPASLFIVSKFMERNKIDDIFLTAINTTSEPLYPNMRMLIESVFHCPIFDSYGAEGGPVISQCENHQLYHVSSEKAITEFYREGQPVKTGKAKMIFTDLTNYSTPFIRYDVKDFVFLSDKNCLCGRGLQTIEKIEGRDTDILITPSGKYITFYFFAGYFEHQDYIDMFQLIQINIDEFTLKLVVNDNYNNLLKVKISNDLIEVLGDDSKLNIEIVDEIPLTKSGKRRFFIRDKSILLDI